MTNTSSGGVLWGVHIGGETNTPDCMKHHDNPEEFVFETAGDKLQVIHTVGFDYAEHYVVPTGLNQEVDWGCEKVDPKNITPSLYQKDELDRWCDKHGIDKSGIGQHVYSFYG